MLYFRRTVGGPTFPGLVDVRPVCRGDREDWIGLFEGGEIARLDIATGAKTYLANAARLQSLDDPGEPLELHVSRDGRLAAVVQRAGRFGVVIDLETDELRLPLERGGYHERQCRFPFAFFERDGRELIAHATDWNRLDITDVRTRERLTERGPTEYIDNEPPPHYLDYFHCGLTISPDHARIADDGWAWHPFGIVVTWSIDAWLANVWESEDGPSRVAFDPRPESWDDPLCWIGNDQLAIWGDGDGHPKQPAITIHDVTSGEQLRSFECPRGDLVFDGVLVALHGEETSFWDPARGVKLGYDAHPSPQRYHPTAKTFLRFTDRIVTSRLCGHHADAPWNTSVVRELATAIARDRSFDELPVLGDALEAAGCTDRELLDHCQQPGEHGDRCWVLDQLDVDQ